jgi:hypothetical protein
VGVAILIFYGLFALISTLNLLLMRWPNPSGNGNTFCVLIPARNEAENLQVLLPLLQRQEGGAPKIYVFDDESEDTTAEVARSQGAVVIRPSEPLPAGWTGKNRACHELAKAAMEDSNAGWYLFLDADVRPEPRFMMAMKSLAKSVGPRVGVLTGFPTIVPGRGVEPLFLAWVGWILLSTNPFGVVSRTRMGHNGFTNGQVHAWRAEVYARLWPNEQVKGHLMEDVMMGRLCAKHKVPVEVANLSCFLKVRMYETWRQTLDGMSKNSFEIAGTYWGSALVSSFLVLCGLSWMVAGPFVWIALGMLVWSALMSALICRAPVWPTLLTPVACLIGGYTVLRSAWWKRRGLTSWKGRVYK